MQVGQAFAHKLLCEIIDTVYNNIDDMFLIDYLWSWFRLPFVSGEWHPVFLLIHQMKTLGVSVKSL